MRSIGNGSSVGHRLAAGFLNEMRPELSQWSARNAVCTGHRRTSQRDSVDHKGAVVGRTWPDMTETIAHQTACYPFQTLLNTKRQTPPKRTSPSHRSMRLFTLSLFTLTFPDDQVDTSKLQQPI